VVKISARNASFRSSDRIHTRQSMSNLANRRATPKRRLAFSSRKSPLVPSVLRLSSASHMSLHPSGEVLPTRHHQLHFQHFVMLHQQYHPLRHWQHRLRPALHCQHRPLVRCVAARHLCLPLHPTSLPQTVCVPIGQRSLLMHEHRLCVARPRLPHCTRRRTCWAVMLPDQDTAVAAQLYVWADGVGV
jgi:hypothetical protein